LIKERSSFEEFFDSRPEAAGKGGEDGFVDDPFLSGVIGIIVDCDKVIEGFDQFSFRLGGVEVGRRRGWLGWNNRRGCLRSLCGWRWRGWMSFC